MAVSTTKKYLSFIGEYSTFNLFNVFARVKIIEKDYNTFADLPIDRVGHEDYSSKQEQRSTFEKYYGEVKDADKILILGFTVIEEYS